METWDAIRARRNVRQYTEQRIWRSADHVARSGTTIALVAADPEDEPNHEWLLYDLGQATAYPMQAAADLGIGSGHAAVRDQRQARRVLGFPTGYRCQYLIALGYPADRPLRPLRHPERRPFDEVVHWERW